MLLNTKCAFNPFWVQVQKLFYILEETVNPHDGGVSRELESGWKIDGSQTPKAYLKKS